MYCRAEFKYVDKTYGEGAFRPTTINNGREFDNPGWETSGFELVQFPSVVTDWTDETAISDNHYHEVSEFARRLTGADVALVGSHIIRNPEKAALHSDLAPIEFVHSDFAANYGDRMTSFYTNGTDDARASLVRGGIKSDDVASASRMVILQFWRNIGPTVMDMPLAFCDARTVKETELVSIPVSDYAGGGFDFDALAIALPDDDHHAWYTYPGMSIDEAVAFRTYDSARVDSGKPYWTPHSAFRDPAVEPGQPARHSIELRATCLFLS